MENNDYVSNFMFDANLITQGPTQLSSINPGKGGVNNVSMPQNIKLVVNGPYTPPTTWTGTNAAYNSLTSAQRTAVKTALALTTSPAQYPCASGGLDDWQNFVSYLYSAQPSTAGAVVTTFETTWSSTTTTTPTYTPSQDDRNTALTAYNNYVSSGTKYTTKQSSCSDVTFSNGTIPNTNTANARS